MSSARPLLQVSLAGALLATLAGTMAALPLGLANLGWIWAHGAFALAVFLLPALAALHLHALERLLGRVAPESKARRLAVLYLMGGLLWGLGHLLQPSNVFAIVAYLGLILVLAGAVLQTGLVLRLAPKRGESVVDVARDPLTKGDDACAMQMRFAHFVLPLGLLLLVAAYTPGLGGWSGVARLRLAGLHVLLAGYALFSAYALSHLWVPRLSGVPAIAAGAIKGELHTSLLGLALLTAGILSGLRGLDIAGGAFLFFGAFTFMGVLGANIMRNKSKTQRVTPEFTYVPWTFSAVFWLMSGVLLGIFLNVVPATFADRIPALRFTHVHMALLGGFAQLLLGFAMRLLPAQAQRPPLPFHRGKWGFYGLNIGLAAMVLGAIASGLASAAVQIGAVLVLLGLAASFMSLARHLRVASAS